MYNYYYFAFLAERPPRIRSSSKPDLESEFAAAATYVGIRFNEDSEMENNNLGDLLNQYKTGDGRRYFVKFAVAYAKEENGAVSKTLFVSNSNEHAEKKLIRAYRDRIHTIRSLYISYSPCSQCVVAIITAFVRVEKKPRIGFLVFHGNPGKCSRIHAENNVRLLQPLGFESFIMNRDVFMQYVTTEDLLVNVTESLDINETQFDRREGEMKEILKNLKRRQDQYPVPCDCHKNCSSLLAVATFEDGKKHQETCALKLLNDLEFECTITTERARVKDITFTYFPPAIVSLRLIQVFLWHNCKPVVGFFVFNNKWMWQNENMESFILLKYLCKFQIERRGLQDFEYKKYIAFATHGNKHEDALLTQEDIESMNNDAREILNQEIIRHLQQKDRLSKSKSKSKQEALSHIIELLHKKKTMYNYFFKTITTNATTTYTQNS